MNPCVAKISNRLGMMVVLCWIVSGGGAKAADAIDSKCTPPSTIDCTSKRDCSTPADTRECSRPPLWCTRISRTKRTPWLNPTKETRRECRAGRGTKCQRIKQIPRHQAQRSTCGDRSRTAVALKRRDFPCSCFPSNTGADNCATAKYSVIPKINVGVVCAPTLRTKTKPHNVLCP